MTFEPFWPLLSHFEPFLTNRAFFLDQNRTICGWFWGDFGPFLGRSGIILASFWHHLGVALVSFWPHLEAFVGPFWTIFGPFTLIFRPFLRSLCGFLVMFGEIDCKIKQNDAREGKNAKFPAKFTKDMQKFCKNMPFFHLQNICFAEKTVKIDVSTYENVQ